jgi:hypothetical protein
VANRLLPAIADSLYNRLTKLAEKTDEAGVKAEEAKQAGIYANERVAQAELKTRQAVQLATEMVRARDYLESKEFAQRTKTLTQIATLSELARSFPTNRTLNILLARLYDEAAGDRHGAIGVLVAFVGAKGMSGEGEDANVADALWNLAYYYFYDSDGKPTKDDALRIKGIGAMEEALRRVPSYYVALTHDDDFASLRESPEATAMMATAKLAYEEWAKMQPQNTQNTGASGVSGQN